MYFGKRTRLKCAGLWFKTGLLDSVLFSASGSNLRKIIFIADKLLTIVSQPSKCLKFMTFREGYFVIRNWMQVLKWNSWDFLSPLILQKMKEDNISQLDDYEATFCEEQYAHGSCYISLSKFKSFEQFNTPKLSQILDIYSVVAP